MSNIFLPFITAFDPKGIKSAEAQLASLARSVKSFTKGVVAAFGGTTGTIASVNFLRDAVTQSRDLERQTQSLQTIFGETSAEMMAFAQSGVQMGLSTQDAAKASTFLGSVLKQAGFSMQDTAANTKILVGLASDLATVYGYDVQEALTGMTALFRGEYDPIEKFGVAMKQSQVNAMLAARGQSHLRGEELLHAQQLARLQLLLSKTTDQQGAFARSGDTLFVQQTKLSALWKNMQATVGTELTPAIVSFIERVQPLVQGMAPKLVEVFVSFGSLVEAVIPKLGVLAEQISRFFGVLSKSLNDNTSFLSGLLGLLADNMSQILVFVGTFKTLKTAINLAIGAVISYRTAVAAATGAQLTLNAAAYAFPATALAVGIAGIGVLMYNLAVAMDEAGISSDKANIAFKKHMENGAKNPYLVATSGAYGYGAALQEVMVKQEIVAKGMSSTLDEFKYQQDLAKNKPFDFQAYVDQMLKDMKDASASSGTKSKIKTFFDDLNEAMKKQALTSQLSGFGASSALIDAILGSSAWEASANKIIAGGKAAVAKIQSQFNQTKAGLEEIAKAAEEAAKKLEEYQKAVQAAADFAKEMKEVVAELSSGGIVQSLGVFEQSIVSTFESITSKVKEAIQNDLIRPEDSKKLLDYAAASEVAMRAIAKQRDALSERIQAVRDLISATKSAVVGFVNITSLLETTTKTVTETMVSVTDGIRLTLTRSMDVTSVSGSITDRFKEILAKTKQFAINLRELKRMGLDQNLFKQIVDAGLESGGATAAAIIEGGAGTVSELNSLFTDLQTTGTDIAEQTAQVMYGAGVDISNGLINGLLAQESALAAAAKKLADGFASTFNASIAGALKNALPAAPAASPVATSTIGIGGGLAAQLNAMGFFASGVATGSSNRLTAPQSVINLVVNAQNSGMTGTELAQQMITEIKKYERVNGAIWQAAG